MSEPIELRLPEPLRLSESAEVALEDYAREVTRSERTEALRGTDPGLPVFALRLFGLRAAPDEHAKADVLAFARELFERGESAGLGWS
jgi:hypothetical protein